MSFQPETVSYQTIQEYLQDCAKYGGEELPEGFERWTSLVELQFYPRTPIGSYSVQAPTLDDAVRQAHEILDGEGE